MEENTPFPYLHGFSAEEQDRLRRQARFTENIIYKDLDFSRTKNLIEVGCGVGAQTEILLRRFPELHITGIDLSDNQLNTAKSHLKSLSYAKGRYQIEKMNATSIEYEANTYDGAFLCWILEHVDQPGNVLSEVRRVLRPGATIVVNEVLNSSFFLDPYSPNVWKYWMAFNDYQLEKTGDPFIGAKLGNLLLAGGFTQIKTYVKNLFFDNRCPDQRKETIDYWTDLLMSAKDQLINDKVITKKLADDAHAELKAVARDPNAVFYYSFIQATAQKN